MHVIIFFYKGMSGFLVFQESEERTYDEFALGLFSGSRSCPKERI
jgi:hypothetical protein